MQAVNEAPRAPQLYEPLDSTTTLTAPSAPGRPVAADDGGAAARRKANINAVINITANVILPLVLYYVLKDHMSLLLALVISGIPPAVYVVYNAIRYRTIEYFGVIILLSFVLTLIVAKATDNPRVLLLKDSIVLLLMGLAWLFTLLPITRNGERQRPLIYTMVSKADPVHFDMVWKTIPRFRMFVRGLTWMWGLGLTGEFVAKVLVVLLVSDVQQASNIATIMSPAVVGALAFLNMLVTLKMRREAAAADARKVASEPAAEV
ncbi:hypothetical protein HDU87_001258 [Geranomyces variabilis]|uniref:Intracellular septation protein A n=1 Tax=Geranomyces variabilis TaxID=109894 RepID=A0AAD5XI78_9FUNG|nr:hypothetical protein HDU87_001258 [Geranomyces variabilis]